MNRLYLIDKLEILEKKFGTKYQYSSLLPWDFNCNDVIKVQEAGKKLAKHLGLTGLTFIVSYSNQKYGTAGHIQLDNSLDVYIEISSEFKNSPHAVLTIIAHELCHKVLQINNIALLPEFDNEVLTDLAVIYFGLGKIMLMGCESNSHRIGYLQRHEYAFVYMLNAILRNLTKDEIKFGLPEEIIKKLSLDLLILDYGERKEISNTVLIESITNIDDTKMELYKEAAQIENYIYKVENHVLNPLRQKTIQFHSTIFNFKKKADELLNKENSNVRLNELRNIRITEQLEKQNEQLLNIVKSFSEIKKLLLGIGSIIELEDNKINYNQNREFSCPCCEKKMRIPFNKIAKIICINCKYPFIVNSYDTLLSDENDRKSKPEINKKNEKRWISNLKFMFRRFK